MFCHVSSHEPRTSSDNWHGAFQNIFSPCRRKDHISSWAMRLASQQKACNVFKWPLRQEVIPPTKQLKMPLCLSLSNTYPYFDNSFKLSFYLLSNKNMTICAINGSLTWKEIASPIYLNLYHVLDYLTVEIIMIIQLKWLTISIIYVATFWI